MSSFYVKYFTQKQCLEKSCLAGTASCFSFCHSREGGDPVIKEIELLCLDCRATLEMTNGGCHALPEVVDKEYEKLGPRLRGNDIEGIVTILVRHLEEDP